MVAYRKVSPHQDEKSGSRLVTGAKAECMIPVAP